MIEPVAGDRRVLVRGGHVWTPPGGAPVTAMATEGGLVRWLGDDAGARAWQDDAHEVVELDGALVTPGFVDAHVHLAATGFAQRGLDLSAAASGQEVLDLLTAHLRVHGDRVVVGHGWDDSTWPDGRPTRAQLDRVLQGRIALLSRVDAHSSLVSTTLVDLDPEIAASAGWREDGWVERDAHHRSLAALESAQSDAERRDAVERALRAAARAGLVGVHEMGAPHLSRPRDAELFADLAAEHALPEVVAYWGERDAFEVLESHGFAGLAGDLCCDGAVGSRTAAVLEPYVDDGTSGHLYLDRDEVAEHVHACAVRGVQPGFHAIGDAAVAAALDGIDDAARRLGTAAVGAVRPRLEHLELVSPERVADAARLGVHASVQPCFDAEWGGPGGLYERRLGAARAARMNPFAELVAAGVPLALGSDAPVTPVGPWPAVLAATRHRTPGQSLDLATAIDAHARGGWAAARRDAHGVLGVGRPASYAVWEPPERSGPHGSARVLAEAVATLPAPRCRRTVHDGRVLHAEPV